MLNFIFLLFVVCSAFLIALNFIFYNPELVTFFRNVTSGDWLQIVATIGSVGIAYYFANKQISLTLKQINDDHQRDQNRFDDVQASLCQLFLNQYVQQYINWGTEASRLEAFNADKVGTHVFYFDKHSSKELNTVFLQNYSYLPKNIQTLLNKIDDVQKIYHWQRSSVMICNQIRNGDSIHLSINNYPNLAVLWNDTENKLADDARQKAVSVLEETLSSYFKALSDFLALVENAVEQATHIIEKRAHLSL